MAFGFYAESKKVPRAGGMAAVKGRLWHSVLEGRPHSPGKSKAHSAEVSPWPPRLGPWPCGKRVKSRGRRGGMREEAQGGWQIWRLPYNLPLRWAAWDFQLDSAVLDKW